MGDENTNGKLNGYVNNMLFQMITKSTEVMTELIKTIESVEDSLKSISDHCVREDFRTEEDIKKTALIMKLLIANIAIGVITIITLAFGAAPGWLLELITRFIP